MKEITEEIVKKLIQPHPQKSHKGDYGRLLVIGGEEQYGGSGILASSAAAFSGAGLVTLACDNKNRNAVLSRVPEVMVVDFENTEKVLELANNSDVILVGPGLGLGKGKLLKEVLENQKEDQNLIIDGSAITLFTLEDLELNYPDRVIFTPHQMEMKRLSGIKIVDQNDEAVQSFVDKMRINLVLKSNNTKVFIPKEEASFLSIGGPYQAVGGMGDVLAGMVAAFVAQYSAKNLQESIKAATFLHSWIADKISKENFIVLPHRLVEEIPSSMLFFQKLDS